MFSGFVQGKQGERSMDFLYYQGGAARDLDGGGITSAFGACPYPPGRCSLRLLGRGALRSSDRCRLRFAPLDLALAPSHLLPTLRGEWDLCTRCALTLPRSLRPRGALRALQGTPKNRGKQHRGSFLRRYDGAARGGRKKMRKAAPIGGITAIRLRLALRGCWRGDRCA